MMGDDHASIILRLMVEARLMAAQALIKPPASRA